MGASIRGLDNEAMSDETQQTPPPPPPPPPADDPVGRRLLRRSRTDRVIGGVCGGLGNYFGIDPVIFRIIFVVLVFANGSGFLLYLVAWLVIAKEGYDESHAVRSLRGAPSQRRSLLLVLLVVAGIFMITGGLVWWPIFGVGDGLAVPLLLIAAGVALLVWPDDGFEWHRRWHEEHDQQEHLHERTTAREETRQAAYEAGAAARQAAGEARAAGREAADEARAAAREIKDEALQAADVARERARDARRRWRHGYRRGFHDSHQGPPPAGLPVPYVPPTPPERAFLGPITLALLLLFTGGTVFADRMGWVNVDVAIFLGICLIIVGVALVVSAFAGRARGLIVLGVLLLPVAWVVNTVDLTWWDGVGDELHTVENLGDLQDEYRFGMGELIVDLSELDLSGESRNLAVGLTIGEAVVYVPEDMHVVVDLDGRIGEIVIDDAGGRNSDDGIDLALQAELGDPDADHVLELDFDLGIGSGRVEVCTDSGTEGLVRCP